MLGWDMHVTISIGGEKNRLARIKGGFADTDWLDAMVTQGHATDEGGNGYPYVYLSSLRHFRVALRALGKRPSLRIEMFYGDRQLDSLPVDSPVKIECWDES